MRKQVVQALKPGWGTQHYLRALSFSRLKSLLGWQPVGHFMWLHEHHFLGLLLVTPFPSLCSSPSWGRGLTALHLMMWAWGWKELGPGSWLSPQGKPHLELTGLQSVVVHSQMLDSLMGRKGVQFQKTMNMKRSIQTPLNLAPRVR